MVKIKEENGSFVVYLRGEKAAIFQTEKEARDFSSTLTQYPEQEEQWISNQEEELKDGVRD